MEEFIQLLVDRSILFNVRKVEEDFRYEPHIYIYIKDNEDNTLYRIDINFKKNWKPIYSWYDFTEDSLIEVLNIPKAEVITNIKKIDF